jgi:hypothetical protein
MVQEKTVAEKVRAQVLIKALARAKVEVKVKAPEKVAN